MGVVYEAEDLRLGRHVALKLIAGSATPDPAALERFYREARIASALNHPGICTIHEIDETGGQPFLIMELLEGQSLDRLYAGQAVPLPRLIEIGIQLADALDAAHRKGILHRDIKPANIFITGSGQAKILDFGLARIETASSDATRSGISDRDKLTRSGATLGTVAYMSPEQARGESLDARSDLFSLGVVLYEMATANHPFSGTTSAVVFDKLLNYHPPSAVSLNRDLPPEFEQILNKALEKDRDLRYQSASDLRADLRRLQRASTGIHAAAVPLPASTSSYPGMIRAGSSAQPAASAYSTPVPAAAPLQIVPPRPAGMRFRPALFIGGLVALLVTASAIAGIQYFARRKAATIGAAAPSVTATATNTPSRPASVTAAATNPAATPPVTAAQTPSLAKPTTAKPSAATPKSTTAVSHTPAPAPPPTPATPAPAVSTFEADAGAPSPSDASFAEAPGPLKIPSRRAYVASPALTARHMHHFGDFCVGTLQFTPEILNFTSDVHSFHLTRDQISSIDGNAVVESSGRKWRFQVPGHTIHFVHNMLQRWYAATPAPH